MTFDKAKANIIAAYTFENLNNTACNTTILIPYVNDSNESNRPIITNLLLDGNNINYEWSDLTENFSEVYQYEIWEDEHYLVELKIPFEANETKVVEIHYTRDYMVYDYYDNNEIYYSYRYFVGSARLWNHSIEEASFNFWVPKAMCDNIQKIQEYWYKDYLGNNTSTITEYENYYFLSVKYENWTLPTRQDGSINFLNDYVSISWKERKPFYLQAGFHSLLWFVLIPVIGLGSLLMISKRRKGTKI